MSEASAPAGTLRTWTIAAFGHWPIFAGWLILAVPTLITLAREAWSLEIGAHGPIVLATGVWTAGHAIASLPSDRKPGHPAVTTAILAVALPLYVFGRAFDFLSVQAAALWATTVAISWALTGRSIRALAFSFVYLAFLIPPPGWLVDQTTAPLQQFASFAATKTLSAFGYPILRNGVTIFIAQYQLLVEQACSGMNSIVGLTAISLFYVHFLYGTSWRYSAVLIAFIFPIAILTNVIRVIALILVTYYLGDAAAQGFLHVTTGVLLFSVALTLMVGLDALFRRLLAGTHWGPV